MRSRPVVFLAGRAVVITKHRRMSTSTGLAGDAVKAVDAAGAVAKLALVYTDRLALRGGRCGQQGLPAVLRG